MSEPRHEDDRVEFHYGHQGIPKGVRWMWALFLVAALIAFALLVIPEIVRDLGG